MGGDTEKKIFRVARTNLHIRSAGVKVERGTYVLASKEFHSTFKFHFDKPAIPFDIKTHNQTEIDYNPAKKKLPAKTTSDETASQKRTGKRSGNLPVKKAAPGLSTKAGLTKKAKKKVKKTPK